MEKIITNNKYGRAVANYLAFISLIHADISKYADMVKKSLYWKLIWNTLQKYTANIVKIQALTPLDHYHKINNMAIIFIVRKK